MKSWQSPIMKMHKALQNVEI